jgi:hypothetical protein
MSEIDNEDYKREYLPLVNNKSETQSERNGGRINLSDNVGRKTGEAQGSSAAAGEDQPGFFKRNKKPLLIGGGILLGIGVILAIVLPLVLKPSPSPPTPPPIPPIPPVPPVPPGPNPPPMPDPYTYQEFNAFYLDKNFTPEVSTFQANFILFFNYSAVANASTSTSSSADDSLRVHRRGRTLEEVPKAIRNFMA